MLHTTTKQLEIRIDINIEITQVDHCTWMFTCRICRLALEITFLLNKYFVLQMTYELLSQRRNLISGGGGGVLIEHGGWKILKKKNKRRDAYQGLERVPKLDKRKKKTS